jgi:hypothetical protein
MMDIDRRFALLFLAVPWAEMTANFHTFASTLGATPGKNSSSACESKLSESSKSSEELLLLAYFDTFKTQSNLFPCSSWSPCLRFQRGVLLGVLVVESTF